LSAAQTIVDETDLVFLVRYFILPQVETGENPHAFTQIAGVDFATALPARECPSTLPQTADR
jgi:hypothetical protein